MKRVASQPRQSGCQQGFTLVEILVALVVMSVVSVLAYRAFDGILDMEARSKTEFLQQNRLSLAASMMLNDLLHMRARPVRDILGGQLGAYLAPSGEYAVEFTRGGLPDFDTMRGGIQRVAYRVEGERLLRTVWPTVDRGPAPEPSDQVLASGVKSLAVEQLDSANQFVPVWPPINQASRVDSLPAMVRITLVTVDGDELPLLVPGSDPSPLTFRSSGGDDE